MREIKFRAWRTDEEYMVTSARGVYTALQHIMGLSSQPHFSDTDNQPHPDKYIVMQYIGLKDKNGREIYEGDEEDIEVIGNIHEHPGLIGEGK